MTSTVKALADWRSWAEGGGLTPNTADEYTKCAAEFFAKTGLEFNCVTLQDLTAYVGTVTPSRARHTYWALNNFWKWLRASGLDDRNPVEFMPYTPQSIKVPEAFSSSQLVKIWHATVSSREWGMLRFLYLTGARASEAVGVNPTTDLNETGVVLRKTKSKRGGTTRERLIPLGTAGWEAVDRLQQWPKGRNSKYPDRLFGITRQHLSRICVRVSDDVGFRVHPHKFRATFATDLLRAGNDIRTVQELLGHSTVVTTQRYTAVTDEGKTRAVSTLV